MAELLRMPDTVLNSILGTIRADRSDPPASVHRLRARTALSSAFDLDQLGKPTPRADTLSRFLADDCEVVRTRRGSRWRLTDSARRDILQQLDRERALSDAHPVDSDDAAGLMAVALVSGRAPELAEQNVAQLEASLVASGWLLPTSVRVPDPTDVAGRLQMEHQLAPLRMLVADGFFGRRAELAMLTEFAAGHSIAAGDPALAILGSGGAGKSTLIARFLLDEVDSRGAALRPFAYLSFDRSELRIDEPLTLLREAAAQLGAQIASVRDQAVSLVDATTRSVLRARGAAASRRAVQDSAGVRRTKTRSDELVLLGRYADLVARAAPSVPALWVLDTFEVAQRQSGESAGRLWEFLDELAARSPGLRLVFAGRAPVTGFQVDQRFLDNLDEQSAADFLRHLVAGLALPTGVVDDVLHVLPPHPLTLRLAAILLGRLAQQPGGFADSQPTELLGALEDAQVQGLLYRRILDRIADARVRQLVHTGLVVRTITPEVIAAFLAAESGLGPVSTAEADELFVALSREVGVVESNGAGGLVQRPELRQLWLGLAERDESARVRATREAALAYYAARSSFADRVEELYYRLALGQDSQTIDAHFDVLAARALEPSLEELPPAAQAYLASRLGLSVASDVRDAADDLAWARQVSTTARRLLDEGNPTGALELLRERRNDTVLPHTAALTVEALAATADLAQAAAQGAEFIDWALQRGDLDLCIDLGLLDARIAEEVGEFARAYEQLERVVGWCDRTDDVLSRISAQVAMLRLDRRSGQPEHSGVRRALIIAAEKMSARDRAANPALIRELAAELGRDAPWLADEALKLGGHAISGQTQLAPQGSDLTSSEAGQMISEQLQGGASDEAYESVVADLQSESDESSFL